MKLSLYIKRFWHGLNQMRSFWEKLFILALGIFITLMLILSTVFIPLLIKVHSDFGQILKECKFDIKFNVDKICFSGECNSTITQEPLIRYYGGELLRYMK